MREGRWVDPPELEVGDKVKVGLRVGEIIRFEQRRHGRVAVVLIPGGGLPTEVPVIGLRRAEQ